MEHLDEITWPLAVALAAALVALVGELLHARRVRRVARLAFGPREAPAAWVRSVPVLRTLAFGLVAWGLTTLLLIEPRTHTRSDSGARRAGDHDHVLLVLDVSPSMRLDDAGPAREQSRMERASALLESFFARVSLEDARVSVVAVYNGAKPVVVDTADFEVVRNILNDLPLHYAFPAGKTKLLEGIEVAAEIARPWNPRSTTLLLVSDGDTVPPRGMPKLPASVKDVVVVGVGDPVTGKFIDGRQSRQDVPTLRQIATRLGGRFHNGNERHLASSLISTLGRASESTPFERLSLRDYALLAITVGALLLSLLPLLLHYAGTRWSPGVPAAVRRADGRATDDRRAGRALPGTSRARIPSFLQR